MSWLIIDGKVGAMQYDPKVLRKLQLVELGILKDVDKVCRENDITYFLDSGSVLGAVRHGGFIPWDDDIDIGMPREDYDRFVAIAQDELGDGYLVSNPENNPYQSAQFTKVMLKGTRFVNDETEDAGFEMGVFIDVLPYDALSSNATQEKKQRRCCFLWQSFSYLRCSGHIVVPHQGVLGSIEKVLCRCAHYVVKHIFSAEAINAKFDEVARSANTDDHAKCLLVMSYALSKAYPETMMLPPKPIIFEGEEFFGPANPIGFLESLYGDTWNQLPPEHLRRNHAPKLLEFES